MKFRFFYFLVLVGCAQANGQLFEPIQFIEKIHDFGEIIEADGPTVYEFTFTNNSVRPVKILTVQASCGCTTPGWSKEPVAVGKSGFIKASYDPKGRPGYFNKTLTITTDLDRNPIVLQIKGMVVDKRTDKEATLTASNGGLRLKNSSFNLGKLYLNKPSETQNFEVLNGSESVIKFTTVDAPAYVKITTPDSLNPGALGLIKIMYDASKRNEYGFLSDKINIHTTDSQNPIKSFSIYTTVEEYFPTASPETLAKAPAMLISNYAIDFARVRKGVKVENSIPFQNKGKTNLEIRSIQSNCSCVIAKTDKKTLKPGETAQFQITLLTEGRMGTQNKAVTIYSNDPRNPVQRITLSGYIED
ncbi:MAG: DUF1573 domain-containing protein [Cyclobacteriaceae bacterium]|nr:DUF1573 domain-containing protein [Cyclobacteriaceae bacterium]